MLSNHSQRYVGGTEGQFQYQLKTPLMEGNPHQQSLVAQNQYLQYKVNELKCENRLKTQLLRSMNINENQLKEVSNL